MAEPVPEAEKSLASVFRRLADDSRFNLHPSWSQLVNALSSLTVEMRARLAPGFVATVRR